MGAQTAGPRRARRAAGARARRIGYGLCMTTRGLAALLLALAAPAGAAAAGPSTWVNPLIGTANGGNTFPGAVVPFGMVQFSPEESPDPAKKRPIAAPGGYAHPLDRIRGFSLTNVSGWGCAGGSGDIPLTPTTEPVTGSPSADWRRAYSATFSHADETARAGRYRVKLATGVAAELSATRHAGVARFGFPAGAGAANVLLRVSDSEVGSEAASVRIDPARREVSGEVTSGNFCGYLSPEDRRSYYTLHFVAAFDRPFVSHGVWRDATVTPGGRESSGGTGYGADGWAPGDKGSGAWVGFDPSGGPVTVRIGISYVDEAGARANLAAEAPAGTTLDAVAARAAQAWDRRLGQIAVEGGEADRRTVFYTALYHALLHPNVFSDVDGRYRGMDQKVHPRRRGAGGAVRQLLGMGRVPLAAAAGDLARPQGGERHRAEPAQPG